MAVDRVGRYEVTKVLGRGAMGVVYLARDPLIDREVALKTLRVDLDAEVSEEFRERFLREARAAGRLNHRAIVTIHDVGEDPSSGVVFIAMEYIRGRNLKEIQASGQRFRPAEAARIAAEIAAALDYAHRMGVVHRDVKPANIILTEDGTPKITDFGVARLESSNLTVEGQFIGTPNYMSPEQITGRPVDGRSDLFSLGVVLYELLTGQRPFAGETMHEVTHKIVREPSPIPSTRQHGLPPAFNPIILKCLEKEPAQRFQAGGELANVLAALARSLVQRDPNDAARTGVFMPDLVTRVMEPPDVDTGADTRARPAEPAAAAPAHPARRSLIARLPLPPWFFFEVQPSWVIRILGGWALLWTIIVTGLAVRVDKGPVASPSLGSIRNLHGAVLALREAQRLVAAGDPTAAEIAARAALDQAPASPAARRILAAARELARAARSNSETQALLAAIVADGRSLYQAGRFAAAAERFQEALALDPADEIAASFLELARERTRRAPARSDARTLPQPLQTTTAGVAPPVRPTPGNARVTLFFNSPLNAGSLLVTVDGQTTADIPFDFTSKGALGMKRKGTGQVKRVLMVPSGNHTIGIQLTDAVRGPIGIERFERNLPAGTDWTLRVDLTDESAAPSFFLIRAQR